MKEKTIKGFNNEELLKYICEAYDYDLKYNKDSVVCVADDDEYIYKSLEEALVGWLDTLIESEMDYSMNNVDITWRPEIDYIKEIKTKLMFNKNSKALENSLAYGDIPNSMYEKLSVFLDEQTKRVDRFVQTKRDKKSSIKAIKASLSVEFIVENNELKIVKIENKASLERLIFKGDTSEVEFYEKDIYDKNGILEDMFLIPINNVQKFELKIPVALTIVNNCLRIQTPINYLYLF